MKNDSLKESNENINGEWCTNKDIDIILVLDNSSIAYISIELSHIYVLAINNLPS